MNGDERKAATTVYKERKVEGGIYAVRCSASGQIWVGSAPNLATIRNRLWFTLRQGSNPHRSLQEAWAAYGESAFGFEILQRLDEEDVGYIRDRRLKDLLARWTEELDASRI